MLWEHPSSGGGGISGPSCLSPQARGGVVPANLRLGPRGSREERLPSAVARGGQSVSCALRWTCSGSLVCIQWIFSLARHQSTACLEVEETNLLTILRKRRGRTGSRRIESRGKTQPAQREAWVQALLLPPPLARTPHPCKSSSFRKPLSLSPPGDVISSLCFFAGGVLHSHELDALLWFAFMLVKMVQPCLKLSALRPLGSMFPKSRTPVTLFCFS